MIITGCVEINFPVLLFFQYSCSGAVVTTNEWYFNETTGISLILIYSLLFP
ncbi:hypothetical protein PIROE2DRAFT_19003 [Piromyces sp. E2]|nr:hypothetical protein PIROE2DRAFT_19003 [Piromyces sp. E2]|eukprot:OUM56402.1 hypothetical protein PIROE2DRAFT_19003 [Piromyces sp. E2]